MTCSSTGNHWYPMMFAYNIMHWIKCVNVCVWTQAFLILYSSFSPKCLISFSLLFKYNFSYSFHSEIVINHTHIVLSTYRSLFYLFLPLKFMENLKIFSAFISLIFLAVTCKQIIYQKLLVWLEIFRGEKKLCIEMKLRKKYISKCKWMQKIFNGNRL